MARWIALLRGINVGRANRVAMADLRAAFAAIGAEEVSTVLQSGNVVFDHPSQDEPTLADTLSEAIAVGLSLRVPVVIRPAAELADVERRAAVAAGDAGLDPKLFHVVFFDRVPDGAFLDRIEPTAITAERVEAVGRHAFVQYPDGSARSKLTLDVIERAAGATATARNLNTVVRLVAIA